MKKLLIAVGTLVGIGTVYIMAEGVTRQQLVAAGADCDPVAVVCGIRAINAQGDPVYRTVALRAGLCTRGDAGNQGLVLPQMPENVELVGARCRLVDGGCGDPEICDGGSGFNYAARVIPHRCACRQPDAGLCRTLDADGGLILAPLGVTLAEDRWAGAGCRRKPCEEFAGTSSWPEECPL